MNIKLRQARRSHHWSIDEAAEKIGISRLTYIRWEQGTQTPRGSSLRMACIAFGMSDEQLGFCGDEKNIISVLAASGSVLDMQTTLAFVWQLHGCSFQQLESMVGEVMKKFEITGQPLSRRETLSFLIGLPIAVAGLPLLNGAKALSAP